MEFLELLLKIIGALVVLAALVLIGGWFYLRWWIARKFGKHCLALMDHGGYGQPVRITLRDLDAPWHHPDQVEKYRQQAEQLGFFAVRTYSVVEMGDIYLQFMYHPGQSVTIVIYDHPLTDVWFDVATRYVDGSGATASSTKSPDYVSTPDEAKWINPEFTLREAFDTLLAERKPGEFLELTAENFAEVFERAYAKYMDCLIQQNSISDADMRKAGDAFGIDNSKLAQQDLDTARQKQLEQLREQITEACLDNFVRSSSLSAAQWEACRDRITIIHERQNAQEVFYCFQSFQGEIEVKDERIAQARKAHSDNPFTLFDALNALLPERRSYLKLGEVESPVKAYVYLAAR